MDSSSKQRENRNERARVRYAAMSSQDKENLNSRRRAIYARHAACSLDRQSDGSGSNQLDAQIVNIDQQKLRHVSPSIEISDLVNGVGECMALPVSCQTEHYSESQIQCKSPLF